MTQLFETLEDFARSGFLFRIVDNGGQSADRYTAIYCDGSYMAMSANPFDAQGVGMSGESIDLQGVADRVEAGEEIDISLAECPPDVQRCIFGAINQGYADFLSAIEAREPRACAPIREKAEPNEGIHSSGGTGIYSAGEGYCVRLDEDDAADDRGPFLTARDALLATLPDVHGLAGEEYHSPLDVNRLTPDPETVAEVAALAAQRDAEWVAQRRKQNPFYPDA